MRRFLLVALVALLSLTAAAQSPSKVHRTQSSPPNDTFETLAQKPYMGWSSWSFMGGKPTEQKIKAQVDALFAAGLPELGYRYINIDSGWSDGYDEHGVPKPNLEKFPGGMEDLSDYLHSRGLRFGLYLGPGIRPNLYDANPVIAGTNVHIQDITDKSLPGSTQHNVYKIDFSKPAARAYVESLVRQFARWKVDFIKLDFVGPGGGNLPADNREEVKQWHEAILRSGRPIWLELSNWLSIDQAPLWRANANGWRIENDVECYVCRRSNDPVIKSHLTDWSTRVAIRFDDLREWYRYAKPGGWNDLDSLELGNGDKDGITLAERQSMFILWSISCAPLYLGTDLTQMDPEDLKLISNRDIIDIDQRGIAATPLDIQSLRKRIGQAWINLYPDGSAVLSLFNLGATPLSIKFDWHEIDALRDTHFTAHPPKLQDLISKEEIAPLPQGIDLTIESHGSRIFRLTPSK